MEQKTKTNPKVVRKWIKPYFKTIKGKKRKIKGYFEFVTIKK